MEEGNESGGTRGMEEEDEEVIALVTQLETQKGEYEMMYDSLQVCIFFFFCFCFLFFVFWFFGFCFFGLFC